MGLDDIFDDQPELISRLPNIIETSRSNIDNELIELSRLVASAHDAYKRQKFFFDQHQAAIMEQVAQELSPLKAELDKASSSYLSLAEELKQLMQSRKTYEIPMSDRPPIYYKTVKGKKKSITKGWLTEELGKAGEDLWKKAPCHPDEIQIVITERYNDQPSD